MSSIFLSHNSADKEFVRKLSTDLKKAGIEFWLDEVEMKVGDSLIDRISKGIGNCKYLAVVLSPHSVNSEWVKREVEIALNSEISGRRLIVLPVLVKDCVIPEFLKGKVYADFRQDYETGIAALLSAVLPKRKFAVLGKSTTGVLANIWYKDAEDHPVLRKRLSMDVPVGMICRTGPKDHTIEIRFDDIIYFDHYELLVSNRETTLTIHANLDDAAPKKKSEIAWQAAVEALEQEIWKHGGEFMDLFETSEFTVHWGGPGGSSLPSAETTITFYIDNGWGYVYAERQWTTSALNKMTLGGLHDIASRFCNIFKQIALAVQNIHGE